MRIEGLLMKKTFPLILLIPLLLTSCGKKDESYSYKIKSDCFTIVNFTDTHIDELKDLDKNNLLVKTIENCIAQNNPDIITLSGDICWGSKVVSLYGSFCKFMDKFKIPYYFVFGNHDREHGSAEQIEKKINNSKYGFIKKGDVNDDSFGNYVINITNNNGDPIHKVIMMDSRDYTSPKPEDFTYVANPVTGVPYIKYVDSSDGVEKEIYGNTPFDNIRDAQIDWYKNQVSNSSVESTLIAHIPVIEYAMAIEKYVLAKASSDQDTLAELDPIGPCHIGEPVSSSVKNHGFFEVMKELGSTKNMICGHEHINDFSLKYEGIRLTYAVKTGSDCYWDEQHNINGCTTIKIDATGAASISQYYYSGN